MKKTVCTIVLTAAFLLACIGVCGAEAPAKLQLYFSPQIMDNSTGEIVVDVNLRNFDIAVPRSSGGICGLTFSFEYDTDQFQLNTKENGSPAFRTDETTLVRSASKIEGTAEDGKVNFMFLDDSLGSALIEKDGTVCRFVLTSLSPRTLWNSSDYYPIRFVPGSVGAITYHEASESVGRVSDMEAIDGRIGGYNTPPSLTPPPVGKTVSFTDGRAELVVDDTVVPMDVAPYVEEGVWMIPLRFFAESVGLQVEWDDASETAFVYGDSRSLTVVPGGKTYLNAVETAVPLKPVERENRTFVPAELFRTVYRGATLEYPDGAVVIHLP